MSALAPSAAPLPLPRPVGAGSPCIGAGYGTNAAPAHPDHIPELAAENGHHHCRVVRPVSARTPAIPSESSKTTKKKGRPGRSGAGFYAIPGGFRSRRTTVTRAKRRHNRPSAPQNGRTPHGHIRTVAAGGHGRAAVHRLLPLALAGNNAGDRGRPFRPVLAQAPDCAAHPASPQKTRETATRRPLSSGNREETAADAAGVPSAPQGAVAVSGEPRPLPACRAWQATRPGAVHVGRSLAVAARSVRCHCPLPHPCATNRSE